MLAWRIRRPGCGKPPICSGGGARLGARMPSTSSSGSMSDGPVAGVVLTDWQRAWGCDPIVVPRVSTVPLPPSWKVPRKRSTRWGSKRSKMLVRDDDVELQRVLAGAGFVADEDGPAATTWMDAQDRPDVAAVAGGVRARRPRRRDGDAASDATPKWQRGRGPPPAMLAVRPCARSCRQDRRRPGRRLRALLVRSGDRGRAVGADAGRGRIPTARSRPRHAHRGPGSAREARAHAG